MASEPILPEEFVRAYMEAYQNGQSLEDVAKRFGITHSSVLAKTGKFRAQGVKLPHLKSIREVDPAKLNTIINEMMGTTPPSEDIFNASCKDCGKPFYTKTGATYCVNCIKRHPGERTHQEANSIQRKNIEPETPSVIDNIPNKPKETVEVTDSTPYFTDPWDCQTCRNKNAICPFHKNMEQKGITPKRPLQPKFNNGGGY